MMYVLISQRAYNTCGTEYCKSCKTEFIFASKDKDRVEARLNECNDLEARFQAAYKEMKDRQKPHKIPLYLSWLKVPQTAEFREYMDTHGGDAFNEHPDIAAQNETYAVMKKDRDEKFSIITEDVIKKYNLPTTSNLYGAIHTFSIQEVECDDLP